MLELLNSILSRRLDPRSRLLLGQLVMFAGIAAIFPVAPLYVRQHGGSALDVALFIAGPMVANTLVQFPAGHLVDRVGRKPVLIGSRLLYVVLAFALFLNLGPLWLLALFRCAQGASGGAYVPALRAALSDLAPEGRVGEQYAKLQAVEMVGLLVGPAAGGAIALWRYSAIFLCAGVGSLIGITTLLRMPETKPAIRHEDAVALPGWWRSRSVVVPSIALLCAGSLFAMYDTVWPQYLTSRHIGPFLIGISISLFAAPVMLLATTAGRISDRSSRKPLVVGAFLIVTCTASVYPLLYSYPIIIVVGVVEAIGFMLVEPNLFAVLGEGTTSDVRGRAMGIGGFFQFGGSAVGAGGLGALYGLSAVLPFWTAAGFCALAALICLLFLPPRTGPAERALGLPQIQAVEMEISS